MTTLRQRWARIFGLLYVTGRMKFATKITRRVEPWLCTFGRHDWEPSPAIDAKGHFDCSRPGRYFKCRRLGCQLLRGPVKLGTFGRWQETNDFMVIINLNCKVCHGRGHSGMMNLEDGMQARVPCNCLRLQPAFLQVATHGQAKRKLRKEVEEAIVSSGR